MKVRTFSEDPYKNFRFKVYFDNVSDSKNPVAGVNNVSGLSWSVEVVMHGVKRKVPHKKKEFPQVTLSRGITVNKEFKDWAEKMWNWKEVNPLKGLRKTVIIQLCDENGTSAIKYTLENCWISSYETLPELAADDNSVAIESITVEHEGWTHTVTGTGNDGVRKKA